MIRHADAPELLKLLNAANMEVWLEEAHELWLVVSVEHHKRWNRWDGDVRCLACGATSGCCS